MKKTITLFLLLTTIFSFKVASVYAASTVLSLSSTGDGDNVQLTTTSDPSSSILLLFQKSNGTNYIQYLGTSNTSGYYSATISTSELGIMPGSSVQARVGTQTSNSVAWPYNSTTNGGAITLNKTGIIMAVGDSTNLSINNLGSNKVYLLNNTNPQIANINISSNQATINSLAYGQTVATFCVLGTTSNCASTYITVQNSGAKALLLSQSNLTIAYSQSSQVQILNSTSAYTIVSNSNPSVITASVKDQTVTLNASSNSGSASVTVCATDMSSCGIINASVGSISSSSLTFNQSSPTLSIGQTLSVAISSSDKSYNISSNSNSNAVSATISDSNLMLTGVNAGSSVITVCSNSGNCNSLTATVSYASVGGALTLSQKSLWLQVGQSSNIVISGGSVPYTYLNDSNSASYFQTALNNNILTLTGIKAGSASLSVCSAGGACVSLSVLVNGVSTNTQLTFGNNNLSLKVGGTSDVPLYGAGGYYISNSVNQNVATITINDNKATIKAVSAGNANATVCQTGGQCGVIYVSVSAADQIIPVSFNNNNPFVYVGQNLNVSLSGGSGNNYFVSSNSNPTITQANINGNTLTLSGINIGSSVLTICSATNNCSSMSVTVSNQAASNNTGSTATATTTNITTSEAKIMADGNINLITNSRNTSLENKYLSSYIKPLIKGLNISSTAIDNLKYFVTYGTQSNIKIGVGERAGALSSYLSAYKKLPITESEWSDLIKISSGNQPVGTSVAAEKQAISEFKKVYNRAPVMTKAADLSAVKIIAYGIRFPVRNNNAEKLAIKSFKKVYGHNPANSLAWNIVRAIAYSSVTK